MTGGRAAYHAAMRSARLATIVISCVASLAIPGLALAVSVAPPGKAGASQYFETIPSSGGNVAPPQAGAPASTHNMSQLGRGRTGVAKLAMLGPAGRQAAILAEATAPAPARLGLAVSPLGIASVEPGQSKPQSTVAALLAALTGSDAGGLGVILPLLLAAALVFAAGLVVAGVRTRRPPPHTTAGP